MSNTALTDWLTFVPAGVVRQQKAYIDLPAFSYSSQGTAGDASVIVAQFNFSASRDFYLLTRPTKPTNVSFGLCIRYRIGETVYRYKLWEDDKFVLSSATLSYARQLIKKNFVLEVWNFAGEASVNPAALRMITSVRSAPTDFRAIADYALAVGAEFTDLQNITPTLPSGATLRWSDFSTGAGCTDKIGGNVLVEYGPDIAPVVYNTANADFLKGFVSFATDANILRVAGLAGTWNAFTSYIVFKFPTLDVSLNKGLYELTSGNYSTVFTNAHAGNTDKIRCTGSAGYFDLTVPDTNPHILKLAKLASGNVYGRIDELTGSNVATGLPSTSSLRIQLGGVGYNTGDLQVAELLLFNGLSFSDGDANDVQVLQYLRNYHFGEIPIPLSFNVGSSWLDNTP